MRKAVRVRIERREHRNPWTRWAWIPVDLTVAEKVIVAAIIILLALTWGVM